MDSLILHLLLVEIRHQVRGLTVRQVRQPSAEELIIALGGPGDQHRLRFSMDPRFPSMLFDPPTTEGNPAIPHFAAFLRKHSIGGVVTLFEQEGLERVVILEIARERGRSEPRVLRLVAELTGRHANLAAVEAVTGEVRSTLMPDAHGRSHSFRIGKAYAPPPRPEWGDLSALTEQDCRELAGAVLSSPDPVRCLVRSASGISPTTARELLYRAGGRSCSAGSLARELFLLGAGLRDGLLKPVLHLSRRDPNDVVLAAFELTHLKDFEARPMTSAAEATRLEAEHRLRAIEGADLQTTLSRRLKSELGRRRRLQEALREDLRSAQNAERYQHYGQLLLQEKGAFTRGAKEITLTDTFAPSADTVRIPLDPRLGPVANAQAYFKKASKWRRARQLLGSRLAKVESELALLEDLRSRLLRAGLMGEMRRVEQELEPLVARSRRRPTAPTSQGAVLPVRRYVALGEWEILVGKNAAANDLLLVRLTSREDWWFHARGVPGAHVVVRNPRRQDRPPPEIIDAAAHLAAHHSQSKGDPRTAVSWTKRKYVRKPKGAPKGLVVMDREEVVHVPATKDSLRRLTYLVLLPAPRA